jgi:hypothetical protein
MVAGRHFEILCWSGSKPSFPVYLPLNGLYDIIVSLSGMGNGAGRAVLHIIFEREMAAAIEQIERAPAEQAGLPLLQFMARIERALLMDEKLVVHGITPSPSWQLWRIFWQVFKNFAFGVFSG